MRHRLLGSRRLAPPVVPLRSPQGAPGTTPRPFCAQFSTSPPFNISIRKAGPGSGARGSGRVNKYPGPQPAAACSSQHSIRDDINSVHCYPKTARAAPTIMVCMRSGPRPQVRGFIPLQAFPALCIVELAPLQRWPRIPSPEGRGRLHPRGLPLPAALQGPPSPSLPHLDRPKS